MTPFTLGLLFLTVGVVAVWLAGKLVRRMEGRKLERSQMSMAEEIRGRSPRE